MTIFELQIFGLQIAPSYYGLMYVLGFLYGIWAIKKTAKYTSSQRDNLFFAIFLWVIIWGRLGYMLFYDIWTLLSSPLSLIRIWDGWMSFHGGMIWVIVALYLFSRFSKVSFLSLSDDIAKIIPVWLFFGRIWNYLNKELLGFPYEGFLAVQTAEGSFFPSPLIEALLEGMVIFVILNYCIKKIRFPGQLASLFLILYGAFRTFVELYIRTPDEHIGYYFWFFTQWSFLSIPMILVWIILYIYLSQKHAK